MELFVKLGINWGLLIAQIVNFALIMGILSVFVYKPLLKVIDERAARIRKSMDDAARVDMETMRAEEVRQQRLRAVDEEAGLLLAEAKNRAQEAEFQLLEKARREATEVVQRGHRQLEEERAAALEELQGTLAKAVIRISQTVLEREFSKEDQDRILQSAAKQIPSMLS